MTDPLRGPVLPLTEYGIMKRIKLFSFLFFLVTALLLTYKLGRNVNTAEFDRLLLEEDVFKICDEVQKFR